MRETVLYVSHDRYFINRTATRILELTNHRLVNYIGNYDYYLEKKKNLLPSTPPGSRKKNLLEKVSSTKQDWQQKKEEQARIRKRENDLKKTEKAIEDLESRDKEIDEELAKPEIATDPSKCIPLSAEKKQKSPRNWKNFMKNGGTCRIGRFLPFSFTEKAGAFLRSYFFQFFADLLDKLLAV